MVGHAFVVNYTLKHQDKTTGDVAYEMTHGAVTFTAYIPGELVFFMPAPTIISARVAKVESNLVAGIFLDYYMGPDGKFTGQYTCVCLEDFVGGNLHRRIERQHFKLRLHRSEVLRRPTTTQSKPIFPLRRKFVASNYTMKGLESKGIDLPEGQVDKDLIVDECLVPPNAPDDEDPSVQMYLQNDLFTYDECHKVLADGRIVEIDPVTGKWSRRPAGISKELWTRLPHLRKRIQLLGPDLFTEEELRGLNEVPILSDQLPSGSLPSGNNDGLDEVDTCDNGPIVSDDGPASSGAPVPETMPKDVRPL